PTPVTRFTNAPRDIARSQKCGCAIARVWLGGPAPARSSSIERSVNREIAMLHLLSSPQSPESNLPRTAFQRLTRLPLSQLPRGSNTAGATPEKLRSLSVGVVEREVG